MSCGSRRKKNLQTFHAVEVKGMFSILNSEPLDIWNDEKITENGNLDCDSGNFGDGVKDDNTINDDKNCLFPAMTGWCQSLR